MKFPQTIQIFLKMLPVKSLSGESVFSAIVYFLAKGKKDSEIAVSAIRSSWNKSLIGKSYNSVYANRAQGYTYSSDRGKVCLTDEGLEHIESLLNISTAKTLSHLVVFEKGNTHSFDKFIRSLFKNSSNTVEIADTYVDGKLFDNLLDEIPKEKPIRFLYKTDTGGFVSKSQRFANEYNFKYKQSNNFHDRFLIVDGKGYIIGPSLKDAADKKPATLVVLNEQDSLKLIKLFSDLW